MNHKEYVKFQMRIVALENIIGIINECIKNEDYKDCLYEMDIDESDKTEEKLNKIFKRKLNEDELQEKSIISYIDQVTKYIISNELMVEEILSNEMKFFLRVFERLLDRTNYQFKKFCTR